MTTGQQLDLSVVVPVFNEADNVAPLWDEIRGVLHAWGGAFEVLFVDDGSRDASVERLRAAIGDDPRGIVIRLARNYGQTSAMAAGFDAARGRVIVPLDGDRQNDPAEIPRMMRMLSPEVDVVCGWRRNRHDAWLRSFVSRQANTLIGRVTGVQLHDYGCTLKAFKAEFVKPIALYGEMHRFLPVLARWEGARIIETPVNHRPRVAGQSKYGLDRTFRVVLDLVLIQFLTKYRGRAMRWFGRSAWACGFLAAAAFAGAVGGWLGLPWRGSTCLVLGVVLAAAAWLSVGMGLLGELLWRTYYEFRGARPYRVRDAMGTGRPDDPPSASGS